MVLRAVEAVCTVVGALVLWGGAGVVLCFGAVRLVRRCARPSAPVAGVPAAEPDSLAVGDPGDRRASSWAELPGWLWRDRPWAVAVVLLGAPAVQDRTAPFVDFRDRRIDWTGMLAAAEHWPPDQRLLVLTAYELAFDTASEVERVLSEPVVLRDLMTLLDDDEVARIQLAMNVRRGRTAVDEALSRLSG